MTDQKALEKADRTPPKITDGDQFVAALKRWQHGGLNILTPFSNITGLADRHAIIATMVQIDTDPLHGEVYDGKGGMPFLKPNEVAIAKNGLRKIAECAALTTKTTRTDDRSIPYLWEVKCIASYRAIDGAVVTREATCEWDLRDQSPRLKGWTAQQLSEGRKHGLRNCETRAINAAIREFGIKQKYTKDELAKPFVVLRVAYQPDLTDPLTREIVTRQALAGTSALYAGSGRTLPPGDGDVIDMPPETEARTAGPKSGQGEADPLDGLSTEDVPAAQAGTVITSVTKDPRGGYLFRTAAHGDKPIHFEGDDLARAVLDAKKTQTPVQPDVEVKGQDLHLISLTIAGEVKGALLEDAKL